MLIKGRLVIHNNNENYKLENIDGESLREVKVPERSIMAIDGSTSRTGISILGYDGKPLVIFAVIRDNNESHVEYKVNLKRVIGAVLLGNKSIDTAVYEEPFIEYSSAAKHLLMLRTFVEELIVEHRPELDHIRFIEINNKKWKRIFLRPDKCPSSSQLEKKAVRDKLLSTFPYLDGISQDEIDSVAMGLAVLSEINAGNVGKLASRKQGRRFSYNIEFIGADNDDEAFAEIGDNLSDMGIPVRVAEEGVRFIELNGREDFEDVIFNSLACEDKLLIFKFRSKHFGNIVLKHRIGELASMYNWIYAFVWRKHRK